MSGEASEKIFSYAVAFPVLRNHQTEFHDVYFLENKCAKWFVYEKGSDRSSVRMRYEISYETIRSALFQIREYIVKTNLLKSSFCSNDGFHVYLKRELDEQTMNSVKARGVIYSLLKLSDEQKRKGVITISTGTFARILCFYGKKLGIPVTVVMPISTADENVRMCQDANSRATVIVRGSNMVDAHNIAVHIAMERGLLYLDRNDHPDMIIGQATLGIEIFEQEKKQWVEGLQIEQIDAVILPTVIEGCGLTMATALAIKERNPNVLVFRTIISTLVKFDNYMKYLNPQEVVSTDPDVLVRDVRTNTVLLDELNITVKKYFGHYHIPCIIKKCFDDVIEVNGTQIQAAADCLRQQNIIDSNAAIGLAAILHGKLDKLKGKRVVLPLFGRMDSSTEPTADGQ